MLNVFFIRIPEKEKWNKLFHSLKNKVAKETLNEAAAYKSREVGLRRLLGEALLRYVLLHLFVREKSTYQILREEKGKPYLQGINGVFFNLSHSGDWLACAFSNREVGIDIEKRGKARMGVAHRFFHFKELQQLDAIEGYRQDILFYNLWSIKESFLKYTGTGLTRPLNSFAVCNEKQGYVLYEKGKRLPLFIRECAVDKDYSCFVCTETEDLPRIEQINTDDL